MRWRFDRANHDLRPYDRVGLRWSFSTQPVGTAASYISATRQHTSVDASPATSSHNLGKGIGINFRYSGLTGGSPFAPSKPTGDRWFRPLPTGRREMAPSSLGCS